MSTCTHEFIFALAHTYIHTLSLFLVRTLFKLRLCNFVSVVASHILYFTIFYTLLPLLHLFCRYHLLLLLLFLLMVMGMSVNKEGWCRYGVFLFLFLLYAVNIEVPAIVFLAT